MLEFFKVDKLLKFAKFNSVAFKKEPRLLLLRAPSSVSGHVWDSTGLPFRPPEYGQDIRTGKRALHPLVIGEKPR